MFSSFCAGFDDGVRDAVFQWHSLRLLTVDHPTPTSTQLSARIDPPENPLGRGLAVLVCSAGN
jgi:hypothetical protein